MNFSTDRDLLALEPNVFVDVPFLAQQRLRVRDGEIQGTTLSSATADFEAAGVDAGSVVVVMRGGRGLPLEVLGRVDRQILTVSLPRARLSDGPIPPEGGNGLEVVVRSFAPQAALVHDVILRMLGIEPDDPLGLVGEESIVTLSVVAHLEALGTLERVYSAAAAIVGENQELWRKAELYRERFAQACRRATVLLDADGDGVGDKRICPGVANLVRV